MTRYSTWCADALVRVYTIALMGCQLSWEFYPLGSRGWRVQVKYCWCLSQSFWLRHPLGIVFISCWYLPLWVPILHHHHHPYYYHSCTSCMGTASSACEHFPHPPVSSKLVVGLLPCAHTHLPLSCLWRAQGPHRIFALQQTTLFPLSCLPYQLCVL